jgi:hypothetical protein
MAVPNIDYFTLQTVVTELGCAGNLAACFAAAIDSKFDALYKGNKDRLMNFRNYGYLVYTISASPGTCTVSALGTIVSGSKTQTITCSANPWTATKSGTFFTISTTSGNSGGTITIGGFVKVTTKKIGTISLTCGGSVFATITVTQNAT